MKNKSQFFFALALLLMTIAAHADERELYTQVYGAEAGAQPSDAGFKSRATKVGADGASIQGKSRIVDWPAKGEIRVVTGPVAKVQVTRAKQGERVYGKTAWQVDFKVKDIKAIPEQTFSLRATNHEISSDGSRRNINERFFLIVVRQTSKGTLVALGKQSQVGANQRHNPGVYVPAGAVRFNDETSAEERGKKFGDEVLSAQVVAVGVDKDSVDLKLFYNGSIAPDQAMDEEQIEITPMDLPVAKTFQLIVSVYGGLYEQ